MRGVLWLASALALAGGFVSSLPARLVLPVLRPPRDFGLEDARGTLWHGSFSHASWRGQALGEIQWRWNALATLSGRPQLDIHVAGRLQGGGRVVWKEGAMEVEQFELSAVVAPEDLPVWLRFGARTGTATVHLDRALWDGHTVSSASATASWMTDAGPASVAVNATGPLPSDWLACLRTSQVRIAADKNLHFCGLSVAPRTVGPVAPAPH